ncbi:MAG: LolA family protein [Wenzhouxiangella sp.]
MYRKFIIALSIACVTSAGALASGGEDALNAWLERQEATERWSASVVQERTMPALAMPLESPGKVWFERPGRFRWELGEPARTIAVREGNHLLVAYPRLDRLERYADSGPEETTLRLALALLEVGLPTSAEDFHARYRLVSATREAASWWFELAPMDAAVEQMIERLHVEVDGEDYRLLTTEIAFEDGSILRNRFSDHRLNPELDDELFRLEDPP